jgi:hypothetical protein
MSFFDTEADVDSAGNSTRVIAPRIHMTDKFESLFIDPPKKFRPCQCKYFEYTSGQSNLSLEVVRII